MVRQKNVAPKFFAVFQQPFKILIRNFRDFFIETFHI